MSWQQGGKAGQPSAGGAAASVAASAVLAPKVIVPARIIPGEVRQTMQAALAARQQKVQQLANTQFPLMMKAQ